MTPVLQAAGIVVATLGTGAATLTAMNGEVPDMPVPEMAWEAGSVLDGRSFAIEATLDTSADLQTDVLIFENGQFLSEDCEDYCNFGFTDYRTVVDGDTIHFTAAPVCADAPHNTVWYGTVTGDTIIIEVSWTTRRWYWTHQIMGTGHGHAVAATPAAPAG